MTTGIFASEALLPDGWARDVRVTLAGETITAVATGSTAQAGDIRVGALVPGMANLHSHAFQRGMAGLAERRGATADSFWTWREVMYHFALTLTPEEAQAVAEMAYMEMLEAGFTRVGEFHYLHHDRDGTAYADPAEMSLRIIAAAGATGINLTHLPVFYAHSDFGGKAPNPGQRRFLHDLDAFARLMEGARAAMTRPLDRLGIAPHSLRAVTEGELHALVAAYGDGPIHIHIAEQVAEVTEVEAAWGARPVDWAVANLPLDARWCMIHATQMTPEETAALARTGAVAGLCPITEANLGDGIFDAPGWLAANGAFGVGTDSNVRISLAEELRLLEYSQRLNLKARAVMADRSSTGRLLWDGAAKGGAQAARRGTGAIAVGQWADLLALDTGDLRLEGLQGDPLLDAFVFAGRDGLVTDLWSAGRHIVRAGRHIAREAVETRFRATMRSLRAAL